MTIREAQAIARSLGVTISRTSTPGEFRVNVRGGSEATAYYTDDIQDALDTARAMARGSAARTNPRRRAHWMPRDKVAEVTTQLMKFGYSRTEARRYAQQLEDGRGIGDVKDAVRQIVLSTTTVGRRMQRNPVERLQVARDGSRFWIVKAEGRKILRVMGGPFPSMGSAEKTIRAMRKRARRPRHNPRMVRMGRLAEIRYERDHGRQPGFYKHAFQTPIDVYSDGNEIIARPTRGGR